MQDPALHVVSQNRCAGNRVKTLIAKDVPLTVFTGLKVIFINDKRLPIKVNAIKDISEYACKGFMGQCRGYYAHISGPLHTEACCRLMSVRAHTK